MPVTSDAVIFGSGGVGNECHVTDYAFSVPAYKHVLHGQVRMDAAPAGFMAMLIRDGQWDILIPYLMRNGHFTVLPPIRERFERLLGALADLYATVRSLGDSNAIPDGTLVFRIITEFRPGAADQQYWFEYRVTLPLRDRETFNAVRDAFEGDGGSFGRGVDALTAAVQSDSRVRGPLNAVLAAAYQSDS